MTRILIVGGVAGGASTAARLRRLDENAEIVIFERGEHISYANCGLPYYAGNVISERERLFVMTPQKFRDWLDVEVRTRTEVLSIDTERKVVSIKALDNGRISEESYDKLVLSPGAEPLSPPIPGKELEGIFTLRSVPDVDKIKAWIDDRRPERAVVIGGGFIGLEMAENLHHRGAFVTVIEAQDQVMNVLDPEMAAMIHAQLRSKRVELVLKDGVKSFEKRGSRLVITLTSGAEIPTDMAILSIGVKPDTAFAKSSGIACNPGGAILVDPHMRTSDPHVYALGDAVEVHSPVLGKGVNIPLAGPASKQARVLAENLILGLKGETGRSYPGTLGTSIAKVFDIIAASTGANSRTLKANAIAFESVIIHGSSHAGYYPGAMPLTLKALFDKATGRLLGAQAVGFDGVDKRIDLLAETIRRQGTVSDLAQIEHAYAPPFSSSKDPVNILGMVGENAKCGMTSLVDWSEVQAWKDRNAILVDVRTREEFALGTLPGAINIPNDEIRSRLSEIPKDRAVLTFCGVGLRGYLAERILRQRGWTDLGNLKGGYKTWELATVKQSSFGDFSELARSIPSPGAAPKELTQIFAEGSGMPEGLNKPQEVHIRVDACGLQCPGPIMRLKQEMDRAASGSRIILSATDPGFARDVAAWCRMTGHILHGVEESKGVLTATVEKHVQEMGVQTTAHQTLSSSHKSGPKGATFIVFSDDLDRALASFVLANGAAASGKATTLFFTFWGLSVLKRREKPLQEKDMMGRMFGMMLPEHAGSLALSKMDFLGLGRWMMKDRMKTKAISDLESMMASARKAGVRLVACQMTMDLMGITREELLDGVEVGGVATYMEAAGQSDVNLFI